MTDLSWVLIARSYIGVKETPGPANNSTIMGWAKALGSKVLGIVYGADSTPWCGLFLARVMTSAGLKPPSIAIRASSWDTFGQKVTKPFYGAVVRFERAGGGHVALLVGQDGNGFYRVLGGNQSDSVNETWIEASRCVSIRWPDPTLKPTILAPIVKRAGAVSKNEA